MPRLFILLLFTAAIATAQDLATAVRSPYTLAKYVEAHSDFEWDAMAKALGITDESTFLPTCERGRPEDIPCTARVIDVPSHKQAILVLTHERFYSQVLLRYTSATPGTWRLTGSYSPFTKHFPLTQSIRYLGQRPFLVSDAEGTAGSDVGASLGLWFDLTLPAFTPSLQFTREGWYSGMPYGIGRHTTGKIVSTQSTPAASIAVQYQVRFFTPLDAGKELPLGQRTDTVTYTRNGMGQFRPDQRHSTVSTDDIEEIYDIQDSPQVLPEDFLQFNKTELTAIAQGTNTEKRTWLTDWLKTAPDTPESRDLKRRLRATTPSRP